MSHLRFDETTADWAIFSPSRVRRPHEFRTEPQSTDERPDTANHCPFCPGNETWSPSEIYAERPPGGSLKDWHIRVVPNKCPALTIESEPTRFDSSVS
jgi:UDPglucose--hexose-1-phosphate uridylyltransferase